jgi:hypothetical protein
MRAKFYPCFTVIRNALSWAAIAGLMLLPGLMARAASVDFEPAALTKERKDICLKAIHTPVADLESDVNHLAMLSETCRAEYGAQACGLPDKPLESNKLDDLYAYYVRRPVGAHPGARQAKIDRHNWEAQNATASR